MHLEFHTPRALLLIVASIGLQCMAAEPNSSATLAVHVDQPGALIDRHIYGQFAEHLGHGIYEGVWVGEDSPIPHSHENGCGGQIVPTPL